MDEKRILLVVDGNADARARMARLFVDKGYDVRATGCAGEAAAILEGTRCACAIVDVELEDADGLEALETLREISPRLPVVVTAAGNTRRLEARVRQYDVVYYYVKSFDPDELVEAVAGATGGAKVGGKAKILVVDDDSDYQAAVKQILENDGYEVIQAYTKEEGLAALKEGAPNLVILDIMMTRTTDGFHFLYEAKADGKIKTPPVLSVSCISKATGFEFSPTEDEGYFPADDFLSKPVAPAELLAHVEGLLTGRSSAGEGG